MENLYLIEGLGALAGRDHRTREIQNLQRIEQSALGLTAEFKLHQEAETVQHFVEQIYYDGRSQAAVNKSLRNQISVLVVAPRNNSASEVVQARVNVNGEASGTLEEHLDDWETRTQINREETIRELDKTKQEVLDVKCCSEPDKQEFLFMTEPASLTNAVMQSFWFDNRVGIVYITQARNNGYMLSRLRPNGRFIDSSLIIGGSHDTHNGYKYIGGELWTYSFILDSNNRNTLIRFKCTSNVEISYGKYGMQDVFAGHPEKPYITPVINEKENKILYRVEKPRSQWELKNSVNYIEIRGLDGVDRNIDKVLHRISIPMRLTNKTQPMQSVTLDEKYLCWYTGDSNPNNRNYLAAFDLETGEEAYQVNANYSGTLDSFPGEFMEVEGLQIYYDKDSGKEALILGVTVDGNGNRTHRIFMIRQRDILEVLHSRGVPFIISDTGGRIKPLPVRPDKLKNLGMLIEPGLYYLYTGHTVQIDDFPLPREWCDAGWFLEVKSPQTSDDVIQILTRNSYVRNVMTFERVLPGGIGDISNWNYVPENSGKWERVPSFITKMSDINIVNMSLYLATDDTKRFTDFPTERKGVAGWDLYIKASNTGGFVHKLACNNVTVSVEILLKNYDSRTSSGPWTLHKGRIIG